MMKGMRPVLTGLLMLLASCSGNNDEYRTEERVKIELTEKATINKVGTTTIHTTLAKPRKFSVGFWKYFRQQFPRSFALIFRSAKTGERRTNLPEKRIDNVITLDAEMIATLQQLLPAKEYQAEGSVAVAEFPGKKINTKYYIIEDYELLKTILNDSAYIPTIVFSKDFVAGYTGN